MQKKIIWTVLITKQLTVATDCQTYYVNWLAINILQNILFCVRQMKETHTDLEQFDGE